MVDPNRTPPPRPGVRRAIPEPRAESFAVVREDGAFDVIVVGGGINGIGVFRELALQGLRVLLVERNDFCSGCSAAPSRMIHGGLRYLENGEFDLVRESLRERDALLRNAPHLVRPLPTTIPLTSVFSGLMNGMANFLGRSSRARIGPLARGDPVGPEPPILVGPEALERGRGHRGLSRRLLLVAP